MKWCSLALNAQVTSVRNSSEGSSGESKNLRGKMSGVLNIACTCVIVKVDRIFVLDGGSYIVICTYCSYINV